MIREIIFSTILLTTVLISKNSFLKSSYNTKDFQLLLKKDIEFGDKCDYDDPCIHIDDKYLKTEMNLLNFILKKGGYIKPSKEKFLLEINKIFNISPKDRITTLRKEYLYRDYKKPYKFIPFLNRNYYVLNSVDEGTDRIILVDERFIMFAFRISELVDSFENDKKYSLKEYQPNPAKFIVSINKYLFNDNSTQFKILISNYFTTLEEVDLLEVVIDKASKNNKIFFLKYLKNEQKKEEYTYWLDSLNYKIVKLKNSTHKSLYSFCQSTGIKESEIRALNPWINKKATNIPPNAEIIIPNLTKEENNESN